MSVDVGDVLRGGVARPFPPERAMLMEFEREFMQTPGAEIAGGQCYEAKRLHETNEHVMSSLERLSSCE